VVKIYRVIRIKLNQLVTYKRYLTKKVMPE